MEKYASRIASVFYQKFNKIIKRSYCVKATPGCLLGVGNPILDYLIYVDTLTNNKIIENFQLKRNATNITNGIQKDILQCFRDLGSLEDATVVVGGATQNSIRVAQWLLKIPGSTTFLGAVGNDREGLILREKLSECNVNVSYQTVNKYNTGKCVIVVSGNERTLVTELGASTHLDSSILDDARVKERFSLAKLIYLEGFLWITNPQLMIHLAKKAAYDKILVTNLHAESLIPYFVQSDYNFLQNVDILFGNQYEALALAKALASHAKLKSVREKFAEFLNFPIICSDALARIALLVGQSSHSKTNFSRIIVFTQAGKEVILCLNGDEVHSIPVPKVSYSEIVDATGCGDAFAGGFLAEIINGNTPLYAVKTGIKMSQYMLRQKGCNVPNSDSQKI